MKLNRIEKALMNNPVRALIQRRYEAPWLERLGGRVDGLRVLEVGCGRGVGTEIIFERFGAREVHAFDFDPDMVRLARRRLTRYPPGRLRLTVGDVTAIDEADASFDAVFDFGIIHHVPDWRAAVAEVRRVLKPGGRFFAVDFRAPGHGPARHLSALFLNRRMLDNKVSRLVPVLQRAGFVEVETGPTASPTLDFLRGRVPEVAA